MTVNVYTSKVDSARYVCGEFGALRESPDSEFFWFDPAPLPLEVTLAEQTLLALSRADEALGRLAGVGQLLPDPDVLLRPYAMKEALASSRIEGTQTDLQSAFQEEAKPSSHALRFDDREVVRYLTALQEGLRAIETGGLRLKVVFEAHARLMGNKLQEASPVRDQAVWLDSPTNRPETAEFVPPIGPAIGAALQDWAEYVTNPPPLPPLIRAALLHYQFLTIHPFIDGNGRAGRLLVLLFLTAERRLPVPLLYLSPYFEHHRRQYYDRLQAVRERGELQQWLQFFCTAVEDQAYDGVHRAKSLLALRERYRAELAGSRSRAGEVVEILFRNPVVYAPLVKSRLRISNQGALNLLRGLQQRGWVEEYSRSGRGGTKLWVANEILEAMIQPIED